MRPFINDDANSFMTLWFSIMTSVFGISTGVYMSNHLQVLEELPEAPRKPEPVATARPAALEGVTIGVQPQSVALEPPVRPPGLGNSEACPKLPPGLGHNPIQVEARNLTDTE